MEKINRYYDYWVTETDGVHCTLKFYIYDRLQTDEEGEAKTIFKRENRYLKREVESVTRKLEQRTTNLNYKHLLETNMECIKKVEQPTFNIILTDELAGLRKVRGKWVKR